MDRIPMYTPPVAPDAWHQTLAPGGYEAWHVTAADPGTRTYLLVSLMTGCGYNEGYLGEYQRYLKRPTKVAPPLPVDYPCAHLTLVREGRVAAESRMQYSRGELAGSRAILDVSIGPNRLVRVGDSVRLTYRGRVEGGEVEADLTLYTISRPAGMRRIFSEESGVGRHLWAPVAWPCTAKGEVRIGGGETITVAGRGAVDHDLGTRPVGEAFSSWMWGVAFLRHEVIPFRVGMGKELAAGIFSAEGEYREFRGAEVRGGWTGGKKHRHLNYLETGGVLRLDSPEWAGTSGGVENVIYRATAAGNEEGVAVCRTMEKGRAGAFFVSA